MKYSDVPAYSKICILISQSGGTRYHIDPIRYPRFRPSSVRWHPEACLRYRCSKRYQRISLLHRLFQLPLCPSSHEVSKDRHEVELRDFTSDFHNHLSVRFTPNDSG